MEDNQPQQQPHVHIKGKDLPGAVNVLPAGLGEVLAKRESREFKMERSGNTTTYSTTSGNPGENVQQSFSKDLNSSSFAASSTSSMQQQTSSASFKQQSSFSSSMSSSSSQMQQKSILKQQQPQQIKEHGEEIEQESLKTTLQSAITDIEDNLEQEASFEQPAADKENVAPVQPEMTVQSPPPAVPQVMAPVEENVPVGVTGSQNGHYMESDFLPAGDDERVRLRQPHEFRGRPQSCPNVEALYTPEQLDLPDPSSPGPKKRSTAKQEQHSMQQSSTSEHMETTTTTTTINGTSQEEQQQMFMNRSLGAGSVTLGQVMTPVQDPDYDSSSLKRRNPREMYTDSAFYSPKFHPSVAEQVEMAHRLSSSLYDDGNKMSKGQEMYLKRAKKSGDVYEPEPDLPHHDKVPNLKLVMNPDGKLHDWTDLPDDEIPELQQMATGGGNPEVAHTVVENLQSCKGKGGELFAKRRKKADRWVVDESRIGMNAPPSQFADQYLAQQSMAQQQFQMQQQEELRAQQVLRDEQDSKQRAESQQIQQEQQQIFQEQQMLKQQQGMQMRQMQSKQPQEDLPPNFQHCSLKGRPFTPSFDLSCHNAQGIDVWANKGPRPYGKASTLPRTATSQGAPPPQQPEPQTARPQPQPQPQQRPQEVERQSEPEIPTLEVVPATPQEEVVAVQKSFESSSKSTTSVQQQSSSTTSVQQQSASTTSTQQQQQALTSQEEQDIAERKRKEYEEWLRTQELEAYRLEYDCSVKYEEHQAEKDEDEAAAAVATTLSSSSAMVTTQMQQHQQTTERHQESLMTTNSNEPRKEPEVTQVRPCTEPQREEPPSKQPERQPPAVAEAAKPTPTDVPPTEPKAPLSKPSPAPVAMDTVDHSVQQSGQQESLSQFSSSQQSKHEQSFSSQRMERSEVSKVSSSSFASSSSHQAQKQELAHHDLTMQVKSGGILREDRPRTPQQIDDYVGSLRPTRTGELIRSEGDIIYTQAGEPLPPHQAFGDVVELKKTGKDPRHSGIFVGIAGDHNSLVENYDYERHTVRHLVDHFSKTKTGDIPPQFLPQQYMQNAQQAPPLSYLKEQARSREFSYKDREHTSSSQVTQTSTNVSSTKKTSLTAEENAERLQLFQRRGSLKEYLTMDMEGLQSSASGANSQTSRDLIDPSTILQVDGSLARSASGTTGARGSRGREYDSEGRLIDTDKWDNHNAIARGWLTAGEDHYHPVTFRRIYGVDKQTAPSPLPSMTHHDASDPQHQQQLQQQEDL